MLNQNHELLLDLWARVKTHVSPAERLEVADVFVVVFDEFGLIDDDIIDEDLDKELRAAVRSHIGDPLDEDDEMKEYNDEDGFGF
jgi:hypothetical protein